MKRIVFKRIFDIIFSLIVVISLVPLFVIISILIIISSKGPVIFYSKRVGINGQTFNFYKFRTLRLELWEKDKSFVRTRKDYRVFFIGKILRQTHMDELPQFINVIKGDMSIVGPRPLPEDFRKKNLCILPGITGLSQIRVRDGEIKTIGQISPRHDYFYEKKLSLKLDIYIFLETLKVIVRADGI